LCAFTPKFSEPKGCPARRRENNLARSISLHRGLRAPPLRQWNSHHQVLPPLSKEEQRKRFVRRIDEPEKNWKLVPEDVEERKYWSLYMTAYEDCLATTSTSSAPWYVVPADDKKNARLIVSQIVLDTLEGLGMSYPKISAEKQQELLSIRDQLTSDEAVNPT
jgi:hypothetical protein